MRLFSLGQGFSLIVLGLSVLYASSPVEAHDRLLWGTVEHRVGNPESAETVRSFFGHWLDVRERATRVGLPPAASVLVRSIEHEPKDRQVKKVFDFWNRLRYVEDVENYGVPEYWATPAEFLVRGGDCEDYVIAEYLTFVALGWDPADLRIVIVRDTVSGILHAVLIARYEKTAVMLDSRQAIPIPLSMIRPRGTESSALWLYRPLVSFTEGARWVHFLFSREDESGHPHSSKH